MRKQLPEKNRRPTEGIPEKIKVLMYHRIVDTVNLSIACPEMCIHVQEFHHHLRLLERWGFSSITFEDYRFFLEGELDLPKKPVIITFDDGYLDTYEQAFPVLQEFGMKAVVFVLGNRQIKASVWDRSTGLPIAPLMGDREILELHAAGFEIGSHSMTHARLDALTHEAAFDEIYNSRMMIERLLNAPVHTFAFPYGLVSASTKRMIEDAGYHIGCGTYSGPPTFGGDPFEVRRVLVPGNVGLIGLAMRMLAPYEHYSWMRWKTKQLLGAFRMNGAASDELESTVGFLKLLGIFGTRP